MENSNLVVKVQAALSISTLLCHEQVVNFIRPSLGTVLKMFLKIMDEVDYEKLVEALRIFVEVFGEEVAPYAQSLCIKLAEAYIRALGTKGTWEEENTEEGLTADGLMTAIRRVLESISGQFPQLYPLLEEILEDALKKGLNEECSSDEALTCVSELVYNQKEVSNRMWGFYQHIIQLFLEDKHHFEVSVASKVFIYYMIRGSDAFKNSSLQGQGSPLELLFTFIAKIFKEGKEDSLEIHSMVAVSLFIAILEHLGEKDQVILPQIHSINQMYIEEMAEAETKDYKSMLIQGVMVNFWYD